MNLIGKFAVTLLTVIMSAIYVLAAKHISAWLWLFTIFIGVGFFIYTYMNELRNPNLYSDSSSTSYLNLLTCAILCVPFLNFFLIAVFAIMDYKWAQSDAFWGK